MAKRRAPNQESDFAILGRVILHGPRLCCKSNADQPHEKTCRHSPEGAVHHFRLQLADQLEELFGDPEFSADDTVAQVIIKLRKEQV